MEDHRAVQNCNFGGVKTTGLFTNFQKDHRAVHQLSKDHRADQYNFQRTTGLYKTQYKMNRMNQARNRACSTVHEYR